MLRLSKAGERRHMRGDKSHYAFGITPYLLNNVLRTRKMQMYANAFMRRMPFSERSSLPRVLALIMAGLILVALPAVAKPKLVAVQTAVIENTGSTNTVGYKITVSLSPGGYHLDAASSDGQTRNKDTGDHNAMMQRVRTFFADLDAAMPLNTLPVRHGMRSASFGTKTFITYKGQRSPDLTFASDPRTVALKSDIDGITKALHVGNAPRRPIVIHVHADR